MTEQLPPAGWYRDPSNPTTERYWDGHAWTANVRNAPVLPPIAPPVPPQSTANPFAQSSGSPYIQTPELKRQPRRWKKWQVVTLVCIGGFFGLGIIANIVSPSSDDTGSTHTPAATTMPSSTPTSTKPATPLEAFKATLTTDLGTLNRDGQRVISVDLDSSGSMLIRYALNDHYSNSAIVDGAWEDAGTILKAVQGSGLKVKEIIAQGTYPLQDKYGKAMGEVSVVTITFGSDAIKQANVDNLPGDLLKGVAADVFIRQDILG